MAALLCHYTCNRLAIVVCNPFNPWFLSSVVKDEDHLCNCLLYIDEMNITYVTLLIVYSISCPICLKKADYVVTLAAPNYVVIMSLPKTLRRRRATKQHGPFLNGILLLMIHPY